MRAASGTAPSASSDGLVRDIIDIGDPAEVAKKLPQFEILEMLGRGGMAIVFLIALGILRFVTFGHL